PPTAQAPWNAQQQQQPRPPSQVGWASQSDPAPAPSYTPTPQPKGKRRATLVIVLLVVLLVLGGGGYLAYSLTGGHLPGLGATQSTIKPTKLNLTTEYAGIDITILSADQAQN